MSIAMISQCSWARWKPGSTILDTCAARRRSSPRKTAPGAKKGPPVMGRSRGGVTSNRDGRPPRPGAQGDGAAPQGWGIDPKAAFLDNGRRVCFPTKKIHMALWGLEGRGALYGHSQQWPSPGPHSLGRRPGREGMFKPWLWVKQFFWFVFGKDELPEDPVTPRGEVLGSPLQGSQGLEDLSSIQLRWRPRRGYLRGILEPEELPQDPIHPKRRRGFFRILLEGETLPQEGDRE